MVRVESDGPDLPPLTPGLRNTPPEAVQNLFGTVFMFGLQEEDRQWVMSDDYLLVADLAGINLDLAERVRSMFLAGQINRATFTGVIPSRPRIEPAPRSTAARPTVLVRSIVDSMPGARPIEIIRACIAAGINRHTARTQVWVYLSEKRGSN